MFRKLLAGAAVAVALASCSSDRGNNDDLSLPRTEIARAQAQDCSSYPSQAAAQAALRANPSDPNNLDPDDDGIACEDRPAPFDRTPVNRGGTQPATTTTTEPAVTVDRSTDDFADTGPRDWVGLITLVGVVSFTVGVALRGKRSTGVHWLD